MGLILDVPVEPGHDQAQKWLISELSKPQYAAAQPSWFDRLVSAVKDWFLSLTFTGGGSAQWPLIIVVLIVLVAAIVTAFLIFGLPKLGRRSTETGTLFGEDDHRDSSALRRDAQRAAASGDWATATVEMFRCIARSLSERTLVAVLPGTTARGFAVKAAEPFADFAERLQLVAQHFDAVRYLGFDGSEATYRQIADLDTALAAARPKLVEPAGVVR